MTVASRAVRMAVMTEARVIDMEQEGHTLEEAPDNNYNYLVTVMQ